MSPSLCLLLLQVLLVSHERCTASVANKVAVPLDEQEQRLTAEAGVGGAVSSWGSRVQERDKKQASLGTTGNAASVLRYPSTAGSPQYSGVQLGGQGLQQSGYNQAPGAPAGQQQQQQQPYPYPTANPNFPAANAVPGYYPTGFTVNPTGYPAGNQAAYPAPPGAPQYPGLNPVYPGLGYSGYINNPGFLFPGGYFTGVVTPGGLYPVAFGGQVVSPAPGYNPQPVGPAYPGGYAGGFSGGYSANSRPFPSAPLNQPQQPPQQQQQQQQQQPQGQVGYPTTTQSNPNTRGYPSFPSYPTAPGASGSASQNVQSLQGFQGYQTQSPTFQPSSFGATAVQPGAGGKQDVQRNLQRRQAEHQEEDRQR